MCWVACSTLWETNMNIKLRTADKTRVLNTGDQIYQKPSAASPRSHKTIWTPSNRLRPLTYLWVQDAGLPVERLPDDRDVTVLAAASERRPQRRVRSAHRRRRILRLETPHRGVKQACSTSDTSSVALLQVKGLTASIWRSAHWPAQERNAWRQLSSKRKPSLRCSLWTANHVVHTRQTLRSSVCTCSLTCVSSKCACALCLSRSMCTRKLTSTRQNTALQTTSSVA